MLTIKCHPIAPGYSVIPMPEDAKVLSVSLDGEQLCLFVEVDTHRPKDERKFLALKTDEKIPVEFQEVQREFLGSVFANGKKANAYHIFEIGSHE